MSILDGQRILILDEQASIAQLLAEMVQGFGCEVVGPRRGYAKR
jgi:CheY-like chemotaxis protein